MPEAAPQDEDVANPVAAPPIYTKDEIGRELRQAEIITDLSQYIYNKTEDAVEAVSIRFAVALTQDCDLVGLRKSLQHGQ